MKLSIDEGITLQKLLRFQVHNLQKIKAYLALIADSEFKNIVQKSITFFQNSIYETKELLENETF